VNRYYLLPAIIAAAFVVACATPQSQPSAENKPDKVYNTGSRLPARDGSGTQDVKSVTSKESIDDMLRSKPAGLPKAGGM
jgi:hypothetical protein